MNQKCPICYGKGFYVVKLLLDNKGVLHKDALHPCITCEGSGEIPEGPYQHRKESHAQRVNEHHR